MDFEFIRQVTPLYLEAGFLTLRIGFLGIFFSFLLGIFCAIARYCKVPVLNAVVRVYTEISRNSPLLIQLFFFIFCASQTWASFERNSVWLDRSYVFGRFLYG